jgi:hypothetical protein
MGSPVHLTRPPLEHLWELTLRSPAPIAVSALLVLLLAASESDAPTTVSADTSTVSAAPVTDPRPVPRRAQVPTTTSAPPRARASSTMVTTMTTQRERPRILWGIGDQLSGAVESSIYRNAPVNMVTAWYNGPQDLDWMRGYQKGSTMSDLYGQGKAIELIIWLGDHPDYAISSQFLEDARVLARTFKGNGPHRGRLYVVLFSELETYSSDPGYFTSLKRAYRQAMAIFHQENANARVALGLGGYGWESVPNRNLSLWDDAIRASDFTAVQAMQACDNERNGQNIIVPQLRSSVKQLGTYGKPVMISHFKLWGDPSCQTAAFAKFMRAVFNDRSMSALTADGLFAWNFMDDAYINKPGATHETAKRLLAAYARR